MKIKKQVTAPNLFAPVDHESHNAGHLIDHGLITDVCDTGFPLYTPIGSAILENIEAVLAKQARDAGFDHMRIPNAMRTDVLEKGQAIGDQFRSKLMTLTGDLKDYHVMATPEMLFVQWAKQYQLSHNQLPVQLYYLDELHRQMHYTKGSLISRQIRIFGGFSVEKAAAPGAVHQGSLLVRDFVSASLSALSLQHHIEEQHKGNDFEFFYICPTDRKTQEGENLVLPGINSAERVKAYSLGMVYNYPMDGEWKLRYRDANNSNKKPSLLTFGFCSHRILYCMMIDKHDDKGFNFPKNVRPFDAVIVPDSDATIEQAEEIYRRLRERFNTASTAAGDKVALDERTKISVQQRSNFADYIGAGIKVIVSRDKYAAFDRQGNALCTNKDAGTFMEMLQHHTI